MHKTDWNGLYSEGWQGEIVPEAFSHPAKYSRALIRNIYDHCLEEGWLQPGDTVLDPFGGVALGGLDAMIAGLNWVGCELEQRFVDLGKQNIALWYSKYAGKLPRWGNAVLLQGDSRQLEQVVASEYSRGGADGAISSPPYAEARIGGMETMRRSSDAEGDYGSTPGQLGAMKADGFDQAVSSPPFYGVTATQDPNFLTPGEQGKTNPSKSNLANYGSTPGNLGNMKASISSPPFGAGETRDRHDLQPGWVSDCMTRSYTQDNQGATPGNLAGMDATISSPPFENSLQSQDVEFENKRQAARGRDVNGFGHLGSLSTYGDTAGNIGGDSASDFWTAARAIVDQVYLLLKPGGVSVWVVKAFVKNKQIVDFPEQWRLMCEAAGFETLHVHRALLVEEKGTQYDLFGNGHTRKVERKSFFRRLAEKKGSPRIDWETVLCMVKQ